MAVDIMETFLFNKRIPLLPMMLPILCPWQQGVEGYPHRVKVHPRVLPSPAVSLDWQLLQSWGTCPSGQTYPNPWFVMNVQNLPITTRVHQSLNRATIKTNYIYKKKSTVTTKSVWCHLVITWTFLLHWLEQLEYKISGWVGTAPMIWGARKNCNLWTMQRHGPNLLLSM